MVIEMNVYMISDIFTCVWSWEGPWIWEVCNSFSFWYNEDTKRAELQLDSVQTVKKTVACLWCFNNTANYTQVLCGVIFLSLILSIWQWAILMQLKKSQKSTPMSKIHRRTKYNLLTIDFIQMLISITYLYKRLPPL